MRRAQWLVTPVHSRRADPPSLGHSAACRDCEHVYLPSEGPHVGRDATYTFREEADALIDTGRGAKYREAAERVRRAAGRGTSDDVSNEASLITGWLDVFGSVIVDHYESKATYWPEVIAIDSKPLNRPSLDEETGERISAENGEILCVVDRSAGHREGKPFLLRLGGGKDNVSWLRLFGEVRLEGAPRWVVADGDLGIEKAVGIAFPDAVFYRCEGHLLKNALDAYKAGGLPQWIKRDPDEFGPDAYGVPSGKQRRFRRPALYEALQQALWSPDYWQAFVDLVEREVPKTKPNQRSWIVGIADLVGVQYQLRQLFPGMPRSTGQVEAKVLDKVADRIGSRAGYFRNRRRLDILLGLTRLDIAREADSYAYMTMLREHYAADGYRSGARWRDGRDVAGTSSIAHLIVVSDIQAAEERGREQNAGRAARQRRQQQEQAALREAAGLDPASGRPRRPDGLRRGAYRSIARKVVNDFPDLRDTWDNANALDPATTKASSLERVNWVCPVHPSHRWPATIKERATNQTGCPFCMDRLACPTNSVAALYPDVAKEWHPSKNHGATADDFVRGSNKKVWWRCAKKGHVWEARINARTIYGQGCLKCVREAQLVRERAVNAKRERGKRALARTAKATAQLAPLVMVDPVRTTNRTSSTQTTTFGCRHTRRPRRRIRICRSSS
jgi:hypothetical protein